MKLTFRHDFGNRSGLDFLMIAYGVGFFAAAILYVLACERM
jgi:hypothetical protein